MESKNSPEEITTIPELAEMIKNSFQGNQDYMDKRFDEIEGKLKGVESSLTAEIKKVDKKLDGFIDEYQEEKLPMRVEYIENVLALPKK